MGIHYDYKSTRGDKAMKKEAKRKARIEQRRAKRSVNSPKESEEKLMHDIDKPITLEDLTNPDKNVFPCPPFAITAGKSLSINIYLPILFKKSSTLSPTGVSCDLAFIGLVFEAASCIA